MSSGFNGVSRLQAASPEGMKDDDEDGAVEAFLSRRRKTLSFFLFLLTSETSPKLLKYCLSLASSVAQLRPPTKTCELDKCR